jgi:hypothetical protein
MKITKHHTPEILRDVTLGRVTWQQQHLILDALMEHRRKLIGQHDEESQRIWDELSEIITEMIEAL